MWNNVTLVDRFTPKKRTHEKEKKRKEKKKIEEKVYKNIYRRFAIGWVLESMNEFGWMITMTLQRKVATRQDACAVNKSETLWLVGSICHCFLSSSKYGHVGILFCRQNHKKYYGENKF